MHSVPLLRYRYGASFYLSPDPLSPALPDLLASTCSPAPGRGRRWLLSICGCGRGDGLPACFISVSLSRSRSLATAARFILRVVLLAVPSVPCRHRARASPPPSIWLKRFNRCGFLFNHLSVACGDVMSFNSIGFVISLLARPVIFLVGLFLACGRIRRCRVLRPAFLVD